MSYARLSTVLLGAGLTVRFFFYLLGALFFLQILIATFYFWSVREKNLDQAPSFKLTAAELARLPVKTKITTGTWAGRIEMRQYGDRHKPQTDMSIFMILPPNGPPIERYLGQEVLHVMGNAQAWITNATYDLTTRFGPAHAAELNLVADGRKKLCLGFLTRFDTPSVYFTGWYCEADGTKPSPNRLACILDGLVLDAPAAVGEADAFLRERIRRGASCNATPVTQTVDDRARSPVRRR